MRILAIGDPHGNLEKIKQIPIKDTDLILLTGDIGKADLARKRYFENVVRGKQGLNELKENANHIKRMNMEIHNSTVNILKFLSKHAPVYSIQGNVGIITDSQVKIDYKKWKIKLDSTADVIEDLGNVSLVKNRLRVINDLRVGFLEYFVDTCWVDEFRREFNSKDYKKMMSKARRQTDKARRVLKSFGEVKVLVCHQPPYGFLDKVGAPAPVHWRGKHAGSKTILNYIKKYKPHYVFCGHIHEGEGMKKIGKSEIYNLGIAGYKIINL